MPSKSAKPRRSGPREETPTRRIAIVAFPGVTLLDISGPAQVFAELEAIELPGPGYSLSYLSTSGGLVPTDVGMMVDTAPIDSVRPHQVDTLVIPGGPGIWEMRKDTQLMKWISQVLPNARRVASVCLGAFRAGLDRRARWKARGDPLALLSEIAGQLPQHPRRAECDLCQGRAGLVIGRRQRRHRPGASHDRGGFRPYHRARRRATAGGVLEAARRPEPVLHRAGGAGLRRRRAVSARCTPGSSRTSQAISGWRRSPRRPE